MNTPEQEQFHREFFQNVARAIQARRNHRIMVVIYGQDDPSVSPNTEILANFVDDAGALGMLDIAKIEVARSYESNVAHRVKSSGAKDVETAIDSFSRPANIKKGFEN